MKFRIKKKIAKRNILEGKSQASFWSYRPKDKIYKMLWEFHKGDDDPKPSVPHGHSLDKKYKLSIWDGSVYRINDGKLIGTASGKDMQQLFQNSVFQEFVAETRKWYEENHPYCPELAPIDGVVVVRKRKARQISKNQKASADAFVAKISIKTKLPL